MERWDLLIKWGAAAVGGFTSFFYGGWSSLLTALAVVVTVDYITGFAAAYKEGRDNPTDSSKGLSSEVGFWGLAKKGLMFLIVGLAHHVDLILGTNAIMSGAIYFFIANELLSITENLGRVGMNMPSQLKDVIAVLKGKGGEKNV
ncbi:phage holin family protein [Paenibacillus melissococcoides]|uniref:Phage holin family protein n=1 Tax=Paenibacillus melissococcoides TaxID=2912268 RepID=A0ABM9GBI0_9BACL|nr:MULTISPECIES: phage holin family protein [Paenibacillus]MEB9896375.1 phage holin family protein [Bacillus cereus]CAH8245711.1 phage holin family protein [Paenibacillus melissococcoides]CAH8247748.1 phage holin family protein [Paenibacillus melissococcoides]CAH8249320.1 phage holin family protein [Paenibacillus melissococcoides]CAH8249846.1 phage holin family protein [Paenibacillus melissococcoides]